MPAEPQRVSYDDLEKWPQDSRRLELYDGEIFEVPSPFALHQAVLGALYAALLAHVRQQGGAVFVAPLDVVFSPRDVVQPDVILFTRERTHLVQLRDVVRAVPDLAIEVLSDATLSNDRGRKKQMLGQYGVREYWLVDPDLLEVEIYRLEGDQLTLEAVVSGSHEIKSPLLGPLDMCPNDLAIPEQQPPST